MGVGDWLMATAQVRKLHAKTGKPVLVVGWGGRVEWQPVFENNPKILRAHQPGCATVKNCSGHRPYIEAKTATNWVWREWDKGPGEIYLTGAEKAFAWPHGGRILIEPNTKVDGSNKAWFWDRWQAVVDRGGEFVQVGPAGTRRLERVHFVETPTFRHACAVLAGSKAFVGAEGGLHHAAAALNVPAVVLFSDFISPLVTGYETHRNLHKGTSRLGCGMRTPCAGCRASMEAITVDEVRSNLEEII